MSQLKNMFKANVKICMKKVFWVCAYFAVKEIIQFDNGTLCIFLFLDFLFALLVVDILTFLIKRTVVVISSFLIKGTYVIISSFLLKGTCVLISSFLKLKPDMSD